MCLHIDSLPDDCLLPIFDRIPLSDLLHLDQVCHRWAFLQASACARRSTLVLIGGVEGRVDETDFNILFKNHRFEVPFNLQIKEQFENCLTFPSITASLVSGRTETDYTPKMARLLLARPSGQLVTYLTNLFPNVTTLVVIHTKCNEYELHTLVNFLGNWKSLSILKLWIRTLYIDSNGYLENLDTPDHRPVGNLWRSIAQQASLRQLTLDIDDNEYNEYTFPIESYSFIAQLNEVKLFLGRYDCDNLILDILHQFDHPELSHISLGNMKILNVERLLNLKSLDLTTKMRQFYSYMSFESVEQLRELCWRFASLTMLQIRWTKSITFTQLVSNLSSLGELKHLKLIIQMNRHPMDPFSLDVDRGSDEKQISLPQVKILELEIESRSHHDFESLSPLVFPSVAMIILKRRPSDCTICEIIKKSHENILTGSYNLEVGTERCHRLLILSLKAKFVNSLVRFYATRGYEYVDWSNYEQTEQE